jgi:catecholate siderophore receptor
MKRLSILALLPSLAAAAPSIPAGSLDQVLRNYMLASGALLSADGRLTLGVASSGLEALSAPERDLPRILAGTGLEAVRQPDGSYLLRAAASAPVASLSVGEVEALQRLPEVTARAETPAPYDVVSRFAVKGGASLRDTPQALSIVDAAQIRERKLLSMGDLTEYVPGVQASQGEGNRDTVVFRGYASSADFYVNGLRDDVHYFRDLYNIDTVEVLKGPNAMALGRGGSGGAINRVTKQAQWRDIGEVNLLLGSWEQRRASIDVGDAVNPALAWRLNAVEENSGSFRDGTWLRRRGLNPTLAWRDGDTLVRVNYEYFRDRRSGDRGVPSFGGRPVASDPSTFFGDPGNSHNGVDVDALTLRLEHQLSPSARFSNQLHYARYGKYYVNVFTGGMDDADTVRMLGYASETRRGNLYYQADLELDLATGALRHRVGAGLELGRQRADNARATAFFDTLGADVRNLTVPVSHPTFHLPVSFRPLPTDADNASTATNVSLYLQDQLTLSPQWQLLAGVRYEKLDVDFRDKRSALTLASRDHPLSPRLGLTYLPTPALSLYASYSKAYSLRVGEQMSSLTVDNQDLAPETVRNTEIGAKWHDGGALSGSAAVYSLRRGNVAVTDPLDATTTQLVEGQRGRGVELELTARMTRDWTLGVGYAWQRSWLTATQSATSQAGARMPHVPRQTLSLWSTHALRPGLEGALGVIAREGMYSSTSNRVILPGYARLEASLAYRIDARNHLRISVENLLDRAYYISANSDNNISPGAPRSIHIGLTSRF